MDGNRSHPLHDASAYGHDRHDAFFLGEFCYSTNHFRILSMLGHYLQGFDLVQIRPI